MITRTIFYILLFVGLSLTYCGMDTNRNGSGPQKIKYRQYFIHGKRLYALHCSNCHQKDGSGLARLYPPLKDSEYLKAGPEQTICLIRNGLKGEIFVNGVSFNQPMPAFRDLTHLEMVQLLTYLYGEWGDKDRTFLLPEVAGMIENCPAKENK